ncbi:MAG: tRNA (adenosine(37)-N6)-threonylcarbamoyltransferase complex ATPase subunit type 1 TsaE [Pseudomonadota bacterium]
MNIETASRTRSTETEQQTLALGEALAKDFRGGELIFLSGDLGVGKTTLVRGMLRGLGFTGRVKSPTYGLLESYELNDLTLHHLDLYRLGHAEELFDLGLEEMLDPRSVVLIEWPERAERVLPRPTQKIRIEANNHKRQFEIDCYSSSPQTY